MTALLRCCCFSVASVKEFWCTLSWVWVSVPLLLRLMVLLAALGKVLPAGQKRYDPSPLVSIGEDLPGVLGPVLWGSSVQIRQCSESPPRWWRSDVGWDGTVEPEEEKAQGDLTKKLLKRGCKEDGTPSSAMTRSSKHRLEQQRFPPSTRQHFCAIHWLRLPRGCEVSSSKSFVDVGLGTTLLWVSLLGKLGQVASRGPFSYQSFWAENWADQPRFLSAFWYSQQVAAILTWKT